MKKTSFIRPSARRLKRQKGSAIVEGAICFLGFMMLTLGVMEFSWAMSAYNFCTYSSRDAARSFSASSSTVTNDTVKAYVAREAVGFDTSKLSVSASFNPVGDTAPGAQLIVTVSYINNPLAGLAFSSPLTVSSTSKFTVTHY